MAHLKLNNRILDRFEAWCHLFRGDWPVLSMEAEWELVDADPTTLIDFPEETEEPQSWAARLLGAPLLGAPQPTQLSPAKVSIVKRVKKVEEKKVPEEHELPDFKQLAREARAKQVTKGGQTLRSNTRSQVVTLIASDDEDASQPVQKAPSRPKASVRCQVKGNTSKTGQAREGKDKTEKEKVQEPPQSKKQTNRIDIREGLNLMGFD